MDWLSVVGAIVWCIGISPVVPAIAADLRRRRRTQEAQARRAGRFIA